MKRAVGPWSPVQEQINRYFTPSGHPYRTLEGKINEVLAPNATVLDIGCGRTAPNLRGLLGNAGRLVGIDLVAFGSSYEGLELYNTDVCHMPMLQSSSIDLAYSRSVMEHIEDTHQAFREIARVLKSGGHYIFLTPNLYDYGTIISAMVPNKLHPAIVKFSEGRSEEDTFPAYYQSNSKRRIRKLAQANGFAVVELEFLGQYPNYLIFNRVLFWLGCMY